METTMRQVTVIDEFWDNEESKANRRLYDEQERGLQRQNFELNDRLKRFEKQLELLKNNHLKDHDKELVKRLLSKQANEFNRLLTRKERDIEQLNEKIKQLSTANLLESALRQSNIERLHLEKRLLSSSSSLKSITTTNASPTTLTASTKTNDKSVNSPESNVLSTFSDDPIHYQALRRMNEELKTELHRLTSTNQDHTAKLKLQLQQYDDLQQTYKNLEAKYDQLLIKKESYEHENEELKQKLLKIENEITLKYLDESNKQKQKMDLLENELTTLKSTQNNQHDIRLKNEQIQKEFDLRIKEFEATSILNSQLRNEINNSAKTIEQLTKECDALRGALISKSDEFDLKQHEIEQLRLKIVNLESIIKSLQDANDLLKRLNDENEINKHELKKKQDDYEQFEKMHDMTKRENQATIHLLEEKIRDLERKTELQSLKHDNILLQLNSLQNQQHRVLPSSNSNSPSINSQCNSLLVMPDSQATIRDDDSAPIIHSHSESINLNEKLARVVVAKYSYEPLKFSPNDHPEVELPLNVGEYYVIYGNIDEDGFYDGRNLEGRYGLIPSNFIELVKNPNDLPENIKYSIRTLIGNKFNSDERTPNKRDSILSFDSDVFHPNASNSVLAARTSNKSASDNSGSDLSSGKHIPHPINLHVEKFLNNSVLIVWDSPSGSNIQVVGYQIMLDHTLYTTIRVSDPRRVLVENINFHEKLHRISIRTITPFGLSHDQQCTLLLTSSKDLAYMPSDLRVDRINLTSAVVSWWPASSDIIHKLYINDKELQTFQPEIYRFKLTGLMPNTSHKVTIKAKPSIATTPQPQQLAASIEFRTFEFDETMEPPRRFQATIDSPSNTIRLSWDPLSSTNVVRGYRILIDGHHVIDVPNSLSDHTNITSNLLHHGRYLTIRTLNDRGAESKDSMSIDLEDILKKTSSLPVSIKLPASPIANTSSPLLRSTMNGKETIKSLTRSSLESSSTVSSISTDIPQVDLSSNSAKPLSQNQIITKQPEYVDSNQIRTPINDRFNINNSSASVEQRSLSAIPNKNVQMQLPLSSEIDKHLLDKTNTLPRLFIALFDYDPQAMSPNQNSEEELPFKEGQIIKIYGDQGADGFYVGQTENGQIGYIPSNMISELEKTTEHISNPTMELSKASSPSIIMPAHSKVIKKMQALFDYDPIEYSPNMDSQDELSFRAGDIIYIHGDIRDDGFYSGELDNGKKGLVPSNYLSEVSDENSSEKPIESIGKHQTHSNVNSETNAEKRSEQPPSLPTAAAVSPPQSAAALSSSSTAAATATATAASLPLPSTTTAAAAAASPVPAPSTEAVAKDGFFDRLKTSFSWNINEPI